MITPLVIGFSVRDGMSINMHALWLHAVLIWCYLPADGYDSRTYVCGGDAWRRQYSFHAHKTTMMVLGMYAR
jgi:hypothetical protein